MTLMGAIKQLHELQSAEDVPFYYKPAIAEVINVLLMDTQEVRHGHWEAVEYGDGTVRTECSVCGYGRGLPPVRNYCPQCGSKMDEMDERKNGQ